MCSVAEQGSEHVRACSKFRAERENNKDKTAQVTKDKITFNEFEFISFCVFTVSFFLFICHQSHTTPSICFPFLIPHSQLFKSSSPFILNDTMDVHRSQPGRTKMNKNNLCTPVTFSSILKPG